MDFRELNKYVDSYTVEADVCFEKLRCWRRQGENFYIIDLKKAYLQVGVDKSLWPFQTVRYDNMLYWLTRLGFGLTSAPIIMQTIVRNVLSQNDVFYRGSSAYVDDVIVDCDVISLDDVKRHLAEYG